MCRPPICEYNTPAGFRAAGVLRALPGACDGWTAPLEAELDEDFLNVIDVSYREERLM